MLNWSKEQLAFLRDAAAYSRYYETIASYIVPQLPPRAHLCDVGCGTGGLSLALLPYCSHITAVDRSEVAIGELRRSLPQKNLTVLCADIHETCPTAPYDAMVFCLFGKTEDALRLALRQCRGTVFLVKRDYSHHRFSAGRVSLGEYNAEHTEEVLQGYHIPFTAERFTAEFGQPFRSLAEAEEFFRIYNLSTDCALTSDEIAARLTAGPSAEFPYYLPHEKKLCLFSVHTKDIPEKLLCENAIS